MKILPNTILGHLTVMTVLKSNMDMWVKKHMYLVANI